jgi:ADP-dependent NAD(P)H-hydrate dehydratase / NAD(P)H-hydrate epimerase
MASMPHALLKVAQMYAADAAAMAQGIAGTALMENAGRAVADAISLRWGIRPVAVFCGPGNNGGDGFVIARLLAARGWPVTVHLLGERSRLAGDAGHHAALWSGPTQPLTEASGEGAAIVVDALFGAGLSRPVDGVVAAALAAVPPGAAVVAVDVPSGVDGDTGLLRGTARTADLTVTFFRGKPGHYLMPGKALLGDLVIADIGIPASVLAGIRPAICRNGPEVWAAHRPQLRADGHKFDRGHLTVVGGPVLTGAARLAARAAMHAGAGLVTVLAPKERAATYRADLAALMVAEMDADGDLAGWFADRRRNAVVIGPGLGREPGARDQVATVLAQGRATVLDGDGLSVFAGEPDALAGLIEGPCVLTPHAGEFARLFGPDAGGGRLAAAAAAAARIGAVVVLKGPDTVIAAPDGRTAINDGAPPELAVAGSGDVLSGVVGAALAMGMPAFEAAALGVATHGSAGRRMARSSADALAEAVVPLWASA